MTSTANALDAKADPISAVEGEQRHRSRFALRHRLLLLTAVALFPAFLIVMANHLSSRALRSAEVDAYAVKMTDVVLNEVVRGLTAAGTLMIAMGRSAIVEQHDAAACRTYTGAIQRDLVTIVDIAVADASGRVYCHSGISATADMQAGIDTVVAADQTSLVVGGYTETPDGPALPIGMAQRDPEGDVEGYIQLNVNLSELVRLVTAATQDVQDSSTAVTDRNGIVLLSLPEGSLRPGEPLPDHLARFVDAEAPGTVRLTPPGGVPEIVGYRPATEGVPLATVFSLPEAPTMAPIERAALTNSLIALSGAAVAFVLASFVGAAFIQRPVKVLDRAISARRSGDRAARTGLASDRSEFGMIGRSVDDLFDELDRREQLQQSAEEQRDLYAREVQHRVKNLLAVIQVIAKQTLARPDASPEVLTFSSRIDAMIRTNTRLLAESDRAGEVGLLVQEALAPFVGSSSDQVETGGPEIKLPAKPAAALAMALHELATNAVKYGALSVPEGRVQVRWSVTDDSFELTWQERNGPPVAAPAQAGFGSVLISRVLQAETRGKVSTEFLEQGFQFRLTAPFQALAPDEGT